MSISVGGLSTGLDVNAIVSQLMALERRPLEQLDRQKADSRAQLSAFGQLKSAFSSFETAMGKLASRDKFELFSTTSSNENAFAAVADTTASASSHQITIANLAQAHKIGSASYVDSKTAIGGTGTLHFSSGTKTFNIAVNGTNNTLEGIRDAINGSTNNSFVNASIINTGSGSHLVLTSRETGLANAVSVTTTDDDATNADGSGLSKLIYGAGASELQAAANANLTVDGYAVSSATNAVTGVIQGVTLNLKSATTVTESLVVARDNEKIKTNIQGFVDAYNNISSTMRTLGGKGATLQGDSALLNMERQLRNILNDKFAGGGYNYLSDVGISTGSDGKLVVDSTKLDKALSNDITSVAKLFGDQTNGFAVRFEALADTLSGASGFISTREGSINSRINLLDDRRDLLTYRLEQTEKRYRAQFNALEGLVAQMQSSGDFLSRQLANLPTFGSR